MKKPIREKVSVKIEKAKEKITRKCGKKTVKAAAFSLALAMIASGCSTADAPTAQRAQNVSAHDIVINVYGNCTNGSPSGISIEIATAAQANETAGTETMTSTATQTPTVDIKPTTTVNYGLTSSTSSGSDWISELTSASAKGLATWLKSGNANGTMTVTKTDGSTDTVTCENGTCKNSSGDCITCSL